MRQMQGGGGRGAMSFGRSRARLLGEDQVKVTFADVAGVDEANEELQEIVAFLKDPKKFTRLGGRIPKGVLLMGPPGTGKTLLARSVAGEAGVPFFSISGSDFVEMFVGVGASRVRDLFEQGKKHAPCIIFIDDKLSHIQDIVEECQSQGVECIGIRFSGADEAVKNFDPTIAEIQWDIFPVMITDDEARVYMRENIGG